MNKQELADLRDELEQLNADDEAWTWLDNDPSVAWDTPADESYHGALRELYERAGWERCYHRGPSGFHLNVKLNGNGAWRGVRDALTEADLPPEAERRVERIIQQEHDFEMESFWMFTLPDFLRYDLGVSHKVYQCGQSGGYAFIDRKAAMDGESMLQLAKYLSDSRKGYNSYEYGHDLATRAIEQDEEEQLAMLASPRPDRIEA